MATEIDPDHAAAWNNVGVELANASLPMTSVRNYRRAAKLGNTLAMVNLAYLYIGVGLFEEAEAMLDEARQRPNPHTNVASAIAELATRKEKHGANRVTSIENGELVASWGRNAASARSAVLSAARPRA